MVEGRPDGDGIGLSFGVGGGGVAGVMGSGFASSSKAQLAPALGEAHR